MVTKYHILKLFKNFNFEFFLPHFWPSFDLDYHLVIQFFLLSLDEQEIEITICGWVLLCSRFCVVNLDFGKFAPHLVGGYGCKGDQLFSLEAKGR